MRLIRAHRPGHRLLPGLSLALAVTIAAVVLARVEAQLLGRAVVDALVLAIVLGIAVRYVRPLPASAEPGVRFAAREVLEVAVLLLGAAVDLPLLTAAGPALAVGIVAVVGLALVAGYAIARATGLSHTHALLVASGNAICGNSAIAAVAAVIEADPAEVASAIAFTAVVSVVLVLALPLLVPLLALTHERYGVLAGLTVYAVPQVLAATVPVGQVAVQMGTGVKLARVLLLGPLVLLIAVLRHSRAARPRLSQLVPWFIVGFVALAALRSAGVVPAALLEPLRTLSSGLTIVAMAGLGLECDARAIARAGRPVAIAVVGSLVALLLLASALIHAMG